MAALKRVDQPGPFWESFNLGSGTPVSVLEMVKAMGEACGKEARAASRKPHDKQNGKLRTIRFFKSLTETVQLVYTVAFLFCLS